MLLPVLPQRESVLSDYPDVKPPTSQRFCVQVQGWATATHALLPRFLQGGEMESTLKYLVCCVLRNSPFPHVTNKNDSKGRGKEEPQALGPHSPSCTSAIFFSRPQLTRHLQLFQHGFKPLRRHRYSRLISFFIWTTSHVHFFCQIGIVPL